MKADHLRERDVPKKHTQPPIQWVSGALSLRIKRLEREAGYSSPLVPRSRIRGAIPPFPQ